MTTPAKPLVAANWKMHKTSREAIAFVRELLALEPEYTRVDAVICPPFTALAAVHEALGKSPVELGAQTMWYADAGAYTGEISPGMLVAAGVRWVILGHSERRKYSCEADKTVNLKIRAALAHGIKPIVAVGDTSAEHEAGLTIERVIAQTRAAFSGISIADVARCVIAYEPIWAIGTGQSDSPKDANAVMGEIRGAVAGLERTRILYGGSAEPGTIGNLVAQPQIDGVLVGGAGLEASSFAALLDKAWSAPLSGQVSM
jgi:triosephosphate isomerase